MTKYDICSLFVHPLFLFPPDRWRNRSVTVDGIAVEAVEGGTPRGKAAGTLQVRVGNHDCCVGYRAAPRPGRYYYRFVGSLLFRTVTTPRFFFSTKRAFFFVPCLL